MKDAKTTDWNLLLSSKRSVKTLNRFAVGDTTAKGVTACFSNTDKAGEFRKLIRTHGAVYARRLTRKALRYRNLMS